MNINIRKKENFHILLWLVKDLSWVTLSKSFGVIMIAPTLLLAIHITYIHRSDKEELAHNLAVCFWIAANSVWMIGEFFYEDSLRSYATAFFVSGLSVILFYYLPILFSGRNMLKNKNR